MSVCLCCRRRWRRTFPKRSWESSSGAADDSAAATTGLRPARSAQQPRQQHQWRRAPAQPQHSSVARDPDLSGGWVPANSESGTSSSPRPSCPRSCRSPRNRRWRLLLSLMWSSRIRPSSLSRTPRSIPSKLRWVSPSTPIQSKRYAVELSILKGIKFDCFRFEKLDNESNSTLFSLFKRMILYTWSQ